jgi:hypothetical protein
MHRPTLTLLGVLFAALPPLAAVAGHSARVPVADGFVTPVGNPPAVGYYVFRGYAPNGHQGEDWNGNGGGNTDLGDPVYSTADGVVVFSEDYYRGWGNVVIVRHAYRDAKGTLQTVDSLYGHLDARSVRMYETVRKGQQVGTIGTAHGKYYAHLHFEMRKNLRIGMQRSSYARDYSNYFSPRAFVAAHRTLQGGDTTVVPVDTFAGQGGDLPDEPPPKRPELVRRGETTPKREVTRRDIPARDPKYLARQEEAKRRAQANELQRLAEENRKRVAALKDEDIDSFWSRLKNKLGKKKK